MKVETGRFIRSAMGEEDFLRDGRPEIAFAGRSNVGKSSLLNRLLGRKALAHVSSTPGRTRAINYFLVNSRVYFVDLPGYGYAKVGKHERREWAKLMESYLTTSDAHVVQLVDGKVGATPLDRQALDYLVELNKRPTVVATKVDRVPRSKRRKQQSQIAEDLSIDKTDVLMLSSRTGEGVRELWRVLDSALVPQAPSL